MKRWRVLASSVLFVLCDFQFFLHPPMGWGETRMHTCEFLIRCECRRAAHARDRRAQSSSPRLALSPGIPTAGRLQMHTVTVEAQLLQQQQVSNPALLRVWGLRLRTASLPTLDVIIASGPKCRKRFARVVPHGCRTSALRSSGWHGPIATARNGVGAQASAPRRSGLTGASARTLVGPPVQGRSVHGVSPLVFFFRLRGCQLRPGLPQGDLASGRQVQRPELQAQAQGALDRRATHQRWGKPISSHEVLRRRGLSRRWPRSAAVGRGRSRSAAAGKRPDAVGRGWALSGGGSPPPVEAPTVNTRSTHGQHTVNTRSTRRSTSRGLNEKRPAGVTKAWFRRPPGSNKFK